MQQGFLDGMLKGMQLVPVRCNSCSHRFFRFRRAWAKVVVPLIACCVLALITVTALNIGPLVREAKRAIVNPRPKPTATQAK